MRSACSSSPGSAPFDYLAQTGRRRRWQTGWQLGVRAQDLDIFPDGTRGPKDEADFDEAIDRGIVPDELRATFADETARVLAELAEKSGPSPRGPCRSDPTPAGHTRCCPLVTR
jgi:hypothetical protein